MKSITPRELRRMMEAQEPFQLIDVREPEEHEDFNIGGLLIPLSEIVRHADRLSAQCPVILYCRKGIRSQFAIQKLEEKFSSNNLYNLLGGTEAWKKMEKEGSPEG